MSGRVAAAALAGALLVPAALPFAMSQTAAAQSNGNGKGNGNGQGNGNGGNPHNTTTTTCAYPFNNCPTTTTSRRPHPVIVLDLTVAVPGQTVRVTVCGYAPGTVIKITLNGVVVAQVVVGTENPKTCTTQNVALGRSVLAAIGPIGHAVVRAQAADATSGAQTSFTVPSDLPPGSSLVCAEAPGVDTPCARLVVASGNASVLGTSFSNSPPLVSATNGDSFLAFSGMGLLRLLCLAAVLMAAGWFLVRRSGVRQA
jgi:hypothetical protein